MTSAAISPAFPRSALVVMSTYSPTIFHERLRNASRLFFAMVITSSVLSVLLAQEFERAPQHVGVERAAQAALAGSHQHQNAFLGPLRQQRKLFGIFDARHRRAQHFADPAGIRPQRHRRLLRAPQPRRGDELHRARDLLGILHRANAPPEIEKCGHRKISLAGLGARRRRAGLELLLEFANGALQFRARRRR